MKNLLIVAVILSSLFLFVQCSEDSDDNGMGELSVKITDAPSDDANIQGIFVTVADVKIDGNSVAGFTRQTIEISAWQKGEAKLLVAEDVPAKTYHSVTLVLDQETDASGNSPGSYVLTDDNHKHDLFAGSDVENEISVSKMFEVETEMETSVVIDFDLRKAIVRNESSQSSEYRFVTTAELQHSLRVVNENECGSIEGVLNQIGNNNTHAYVFVYNEGEFNATSESSGSGESDIMFAKAVTSAKVESDGSYTLAFLEEGVYEIQVVMFEEASENKLTFKQFLDVRSTIDGLLLNNVSVTANSTVELDIDVLDLI